MPYPDPSLYPNQNAFNEALVAELNRQTRGVLSERNTVDTPDILADSVTVIETANKATATNINTDASSSWTTIVTANVDVGEEIATQEILVFFETDLEIWTDWDVTVASPSFRVLDHSSVEVDRRVQVTRVPPVRIHQPYKSWRLASTQSITSTTYATLTTISTAHVSDESGRAYITVSSGEYSQDDSLGWSNGDIWEVIAEFNFEEINNQATPYLVKAQQWNGSTWVDIAGTIRRDGALNTTNDRYAHTTLTFAVNLRNGKIRFQAALDAAAQRWDLIEARVSFKRLQMSSYLSTGDNYARGHTALQMVIPTANLQAGVNTISIQGAHTGPVTQINILQVDDSNATFVVLKR